MRRGCVLASLLYAGIVAGYWFWLAPAWDPPATWLVPPLAGLVTFLALGSLQGAWTRFGEWSQLNRARLGLSPHDGARTAAVGTVRAVGEPLLSPFTHTPCVVYEYEVRLPSSGKQNVSTIGLSGLRAEPWAVHDGTKAIRVLGAPDLDGVPERFCHRRAHYANARQFIARTSFDDATGLKVIRGVGELMAAMSDWDGSVEKNWLHERGATSWLGGGDATSVHDEDYSDDDSDDEVDDIEPGDDEGDLDDAETADEDLHEIGAPLGRRVNLIEKYVTPGERVCVFGVYDESRRAIVANLRSRAVTLRVERGASEAIEKRLRGSLRARAIGGVVALVAVHVALLGGTRLYLAHPDTQRARASALRQAVAGGNLTEIERLIGHGADLHEAATGGSILAATDQPQIVALLLARGANPNVPDSSGYTPLMNAARYGRAEIAQQLIAAEADLDARHRETNTTALMQALAAEQDETAELLRAAGAYDDTVTAANGQAVNDPTMPPLVACVKYIEAIHAADVETLDALSASTRRANFSGVDWDGWRNVRPWGAVDVAGFANGEAATITIQGPTPGGFVARWRFQLVFEGDQWKVLRENWLTKEYAQTLRGTGE